MDVSFFKSAIQASGLAFLKKTSVVGIDIGSSSVKIVQLRLDDEKAVLETYGELAAGPYSGGKVGQAAKLNDARAEDLLKDILRETNVTTKKATVSIPLRNSFITMIEMPSVKDSELESVMQYEARRYIPIPLPEVIMDWWRIPEEHGPEADAKTGARGKGSGSQVLLVAVPKETVEKYRKILSGAGLEAQAFEIESFSVMRSIVGHERSSIMAVDFGATTTKMTIFERGVVKASHSFDKGFQDITLALSQSLGIDFDRAESMKREIGLSTEPQHEGMMKVVLPLIDYILAELERFMIDHARKHGISVAKMIITGGGASCKGLVDYMVKKFGIEILVAAPFTKVEYPAFFQPMLKEIGPSFGVAVGLALRGLK